MQCMDYPGIKPPLQRKRACFPRGRSGKLRTSEKRLLHGKKGFQVRKRRILDSSYRATARQQLDSWTSSRYTKMMFVLWFLVRLLLFHCMPAGRHSNSTPDRRRVRLCSRLPCGSYCADSPTAVVCSRELVSCGNGGTLQVCCS